MKRLAILVVLVTLLASGSALAAWPDEAPLPVKLYAAQTAYCAYFADPSATPTPSQWALVKAYRDARGDISRFLNTQAQLEGLSDASTYAATKAWLDAKEATVIKLFELAPQ
ncbi:MAG TPA: hypothetical protein PLL76_22500 [Thermoanaerobaculia bacterium]|nr:hypothetical protein [Thermoanaerobaculia bacterium]